MNLNRLVVDKDQHKSMFKFGHAGCSSSVGCVSCWYADSHEFVPHIRQHSFVEIGHEIIFTAILPSADSRWAVVSYWQKNVHLVLVNCLGGLPRIG